MQSLFLVDPDRAWTRTVRASLPSGIDIDTCTDFSTARARLARWTPTFLVTTLRLEAYNGLHLVLLTRAANSRTRCLVYDEAADPWAARQVQRCGAFFERRERLLPAVNALINGRLPSSERRTMFGEDRRAASRGGRRSTDLRPSL